MFCVVWDYLNLKLKEKEYKQKTWMKSYKTECSRELYPRVGWGGESEPPMPELASNWMGNGSTLRVKRRPDGPPDWIAELTFLSKLENFKEDNVYLRPSLPLHATDFEMLNIELIVVSYVICR